MTRLSTLIRSALRSANGEDADADAILNDALTAANEAPAPAVSPAADSRSPSPHSSPTRPASAGGVPRVPRVPRRQGFPGFLPGSSGGYFGTEGHGDWALEREMEIQRLEEENRALREMLGIAEEAVEPAPQLDEEAKSPHGLPERRLSSLTAEDLEADAEKERLESMNVHVPPTVPEEGAGPDASVLGFRAEAETQTPPEQVFDETDGEAM